MLRVESPAPYVDTLELFREGRALKPWARRAVTLQWAKSETVGFRDGAGAYVAAAGFYPLPAERAGEELAEVWFLCRPELARDLAMFVRLARLTCSRMAQSGAVRLRALVRAGHRPGARLARLVGFELVTITEGFELWEWSAHEDGQEPVQRRGQGAAPADHQGCRGARAAGGAASEAAAG